MVLKISSLHVSLVERGISMHSGQEESDDGDDDEGKYLFFTFSDMCYF